MPTDLGVGHPDGGRLFFLRKEYRNTWKQSRGAEGRIIGQGAQGSAVSLGGKLGDLDLGPAGFSGSLDIILFVNLLQDS